MSLENSVVVVGTPPLPTQTGGSPPTSLCTPSPLDARTEGPLEYPAHAHPFSDSFVDEWTQELVDPTPYSFELPPSPTIDDFMTDIDMTPIVYDRYRYDSIVFQSAPGEIAETEAPKTELNLEGDTVLAQGFVPVTTVSTDEVWSQLDCVNPLEVEGVQATMMDETPIRVKPPKGKKLKLVIPPRESPTLDTINTAEVVAVLEDQAPQFDLLKFVTDATLDPDDPAFLELASDTGPSPAAQQDLVTLDLSDLADDPDYQPREGKRPLKRSTTGKARGRPPSKASTSRERLSVAPSDHAYDGSSVVSSEDAQEMKYRRMRDLNNEASKRCRQNRKRKFEALIDNEEALRKHNRQLRLRCQQLEDVVTQLKKRFIDRVANPVIHPVNSTATPINLDQLVQQTLSPT